MAPNTQEQQSNKQPVLATSPAASSPKQTRPAFEKLIIGPTMVFGEMMTGGNYMEVLRLGKQMTVGRHNGPSCLQLHTAFVNESGFVGAFYRGFFPWGFIQCAKGMPVLFVQHEVNSRLQQHSTMSPQTSETLAGCLGGAAQALFVSPLQKLKVSVVASQDLNSMPPLQASQQVIKQHGVMALFDGLLPMVVRRSMDWGIRFSVSSEVQQRVVAHKESQGESTDLSALELIGCGLVGGAASALTHPIDNIVTNCQAPMHPGAKRDVISVVQRMYKQSGSKAFTRAWSLKIVENSYHMAWMYGVGTVTYDLLHQALLKTQPVV